MSESTYQFWEKWWEADEFEQLRLVEKLSICGEGKYETYPTLLNSYFEDLKDFAENKLKNA